MMYLGLSSYLPTLFDHVCVFPLREQEDYRQASQPQ